MSRDTPLHPHWSQVWHNYLQDPASTRSRAASFIHTDLLGLLNSTKNGLFKRHNRPLMCAQNPHPEPPMHPQLMRQAIACIPGHPNVNNAQAFCLSTTHTTHLYLTTWPSGGIFIWLTPGPTPLLRLLL